MTITIRAAEADDASRIAAIYAPYVLNSGVSFETEPPTADEMRARAANSDGKYPWLVAVEVESDQLLGYAYASSFRTRHAYRWIVETSVYLSGGQQGKGIGRLLYGSLIATLKEQGFTQAIAAIALPNDMSITLHESVGFRRTGVFREVGYKNGQWIDVGLWQCELAEADTPPEEPRRFADVGLRRG